MHQYGENHLKAKLTCAEVIKIREMYATGQYTQKKLADVFCVNASQIYRIVNGFNWQHLTGGVTVTKSKKGDTNGKAV